MPTAAFAHFVFVDMENIGEVDLAPLAELPVNVTLLIGKKQTTLSKQLVDQITQLPFEVRLVKVGATRKNALDFSLVFHLGQMAGRHPDAHFHIVSGDKRDFDMIVAHMQAHQVRVSRVDSIAALPFLPRSESVAPVKTAAPAKPAPVIKRPGVDKRTKEIARLKNPTTRNRPSTEKALLAHITTALGKESTPAKVEEIFAKLRNDHAFAIEPGGKIIWP